MTFQRLLFAVKDPASRRVAAADKAIALARRLGARLEFFNAISSPVFMELQPLAGHSLAELRREALVLRRRQLERLAARARKRGVDASVSVEWDYPPHEAIVRRARASHADLVIAECHAGRRLAPWLVHLTDWELLRECPVPVLLVKNARAWRTGRVLAAVDPAHRHAKPSRLDDALIATAQSLARGWSARKHTDLRVLHVNFPSQALFATGDPAMDATALALSYEAQLAQGRQAFAAFIDKHKLPRARCELRQGDPVDEIPRYARQARADVVVMGALSRSGLKRVFIGNTAERVLEHLPCDVLVVKPPHVEPAVARRPRGMRVVAPSPLLPLPV